MTYQKVLIDTYFREPRCGFFNCDCRVLDFFRLGLVMEKVPLPRYSALYNLSSAKEHSLKNLIDFPLYRTPTYSAATV